MDLNLCRQGFSVMVWRVSALKDSCVEDLALYAADSELGLLLNDWEIRVLSF
jgi:hypothetical protein